MRLSKDALRNSPERHQFGARSFGPFRHVTEVVRSRLAGVPERIGI